MFAASMRYEADLFHDATVLAASAPISLRANWPLVWRHHMRNIRQALKRVFRLNDVEAAAADTDLRFCILHFRRGMQSVLDARNDEKKKHAAAALSTPQALHRDRGMQTLQTIANGVAHP